MAEDLHKEGSEEENKKNTGSQDDDDFGLPDLEFEELEELDLDLEEESPEDAQSTGEDFNLDTESTEEKEDSPSDKGDASALEEGIDEVEDVLDSAQLISDRLGDIEETPEQDFSSDINYDELLGDPASEQAEGASASQEPEEDLSELDSIGVDSEDSYTSKDESSLSDINSPDELAALGIADEDEVMGDEENEEEDSLFSSDDGSSGEDSEVFGGEGEFDGGSIFASDDISLEKEEEKEFEPEEALPPTYKPYSDEDAKGGFAKVIIFGAIGFALVGFIFYYFFTQNVGNSSDTKQPEHVAATKKPAPTSKKPAETAASKSENGAGKEAASSSGGTKEPGSAATKSGTNKSTASGSSKTTKKPKPAKSAPAGEIVEIQDRTGRSYVIIGSFIDQDLANDYAKELSAAGSGVKIIFPYGTSKRYRVSVADFDSYSDAVAQLGNYKPTYGEDIWTLKY